VCHKHGIMVGASHRNVTTCCRFSWVTDCAMVPPDGAVVSFAQDISSVAAASHVYKILQTCQRPRPGPECYVRALDWHRKQACSSPDAERLKRPAAVE